MTDLVAQPGYEEHLPSTMLDDSDEPEEGRSLMTYGRDILVVDDNDTNLIAVEAALAPLGRKMVLARSGVEALARLLEQDFALIILDVAMPGMDGFETAKLVRSRARNRATPIIFITGLSWQDEEILKGYELGAFDFMMKPVRPEVLRAKASVFIELQDRTLELQLKADELRTAQNRAHERELTMQRKRFEAEVMERQMEQMAEADRRKDEFLAILAHELRNPLQPLQTAVEVMEHEPEKPVPGRVRGIIKRQVTFIGRLVDDLLDVARFQTGKLELRREPLSLDKIVEEAVGDMRVQAESRKHALSLEHTKPSPRIHGDPVRLVQVICNLLSNAIKYTPPGGRISVRYGQDGENAFVRVSDTGKGIPADLVPRVFDMFVQERVTPDGAGGLGLGLGLVKRLIELHGGTVKASSDGVGKGSVFEVRIPAYDEHATIPVQKDVVDDPTLRPLKAVVCDDAADLRELVAELLRMKGHEVYVCEDGAAALRVIADEKPDVALIDIGLPEMDGYEVARRVRRAPTNTDKRVRLIAMTGYGQAVDRQNAMQAGFDAHIVKPASAEKIMRALYGTPEES
ncbi:MAG: response regulator [Deltaproteobacteria bacterium]|nr:response regulator [Deltaproteobacteria bacterium]